MRRFLVMHVGSGIQVDQETHPRNDQQEQDRQLIDLEGKRNMQFPHTDKIKKRYDHRLKTGLPHFPKNEQAQDEREQKHATADKTGQRFR